MKEISNFVWMLQVYLYNERKFPMARRESILSNLSITRVIKCFYSKERISSYTGIKVAKKITPMNNVKVIKGVKNFHTGQSA